MSKIITAEPSKPIISFESNRLSELRDMKEMLTHWYYCPQCQSLSQLHAVNEEKMESGSIWRQYRLGCKHWVPSLSMLIPFANVIHACNVELFLSFETKTKDGRMTQRLMQRSDSYLKNGISLGFLSASVMRINYTALGANVGNIGTETVTDTSGSSVSSGAVQTNSLGQGHVMGAQAASGTDTYGIQVGTGTTANTPTTSSLATLIANGTGAGQLTYGSMGQTDVSVAGSVSSFTMSRTFTNGSGGSITITEAGLACTQTTSSGSQDYFLGIRDVLSSSVTVINGGNTTATYTIQVTTT